MAYKFETKKYLANAAATVPLLSVLILSGCSSFPFSGSKSEAKLESSPSGSVSTPTAGKFGLSGEAYFDGNRAPASMSPPFDVGPEKIDLDPVYMRTKADYHFALAEAYGYDGDSQRAIEEFKLTAVYDPKSPVVRLKLAVEYIKKGLISEGLTQGEEALKLDPGYSDARILLGGIYSAMKLYDKAEEQYRYVIANNKSVKEAHLYLGALLTEQKRYKEAIEVFTSLAKDSDYETPHMAYYYMGKVYVEKNDDKSAEVAFNKALNVKPDFVDGVVALGNFYENRKKRDKAVKLFESYQDKRGPSEKVAEQLSRLYLEDEKYDKAYQQLEIVVGADPDNLNAKVKMALILIELKDYSKAVTRLKEILAQAPDSDKIRFFLGAVYEELKDYRGAVEQFKQIEVSSTYYAEAAIHSAYLHKLLGDYPSAIAAIEKAIEVRPDTPQFYPLYASFLDDTRQYEKAVKALESAVARFPSSDQLHFYLGSMQDKVGDKKATVTSMKEVIRINPEHVQALNYLAFTLAELNESLDEAYALAKKALALKPDDAYIQDTVGWVYFKRGEFPEAVRVLEAAFKRKSDESVIAEHLGDAYYKIKLVGKARDMYRRAVKLETNADTIRKIEAKISAIENVDSHSRVPASLSTH